MGYLSRGERLNALGWTGLPLDVLSEPELSTIYAWVERELAARQSVTTPGCHAIWKERRLERGRPCWRWVAYVGPDTKTLRDRPVAVCKTRHEARVAAREGHARFLARHAQAQLALQGRGEP